MQSNATYCGDYQKLVKISLDKTRYLYFEVGDHEPFPNMFTEFAIGSVSDVHMWNDIDYACQQEVSGFYTTSWNAIPHPYKKILLLKIVPFVEDVVPEVLIWFSPDIKLTGEGVHEHTL